MERATKEFVDPEIGDLLLEVGPDRELYLASSHALAMSSSVWPLWLKGAPARKPGSPIGPFELHDDDPVAFTIILNIVHHKLFEIPRTPLSRECLLNLAASATRHGIGELLHNWAPVWLAGCLQDWAFKESAETLWIASVLGSKFLQESAAVFLVRWCKADDAGQLVDENGTPLKDVLRKEAEGILDQVAASRLDAISAVWAEILDHHAKLCDPTLESKWFCSSDRHACQAYKLGFWNMEMWKFSPAIWAGIGCSCQPQTLGSRTTGELVMLIEALGRASDNPLPYTSQFEMELIETRYKANFGERPRIINLPHWNCGGHRPAWLEIRGIVSRIPGFFSKHHEGYLRYSAKQPGSAPRIKRKREEANFDTDDEGEARVKREPE